MTAEGFSQLFVNGAAAVLILPLWVILMIWLNSAMTFVASKKLTFNLSIFTSIAAVIFSLCGIYLCLHNPQSVADWNIIWLRAQDLQVSLGTFVDNISACLMLFTSIVFLLLEIYSFGYFKEDKNFHKFFLLFNFLKFSLFGLILSSNAVQAFMFWELAGAASYFLVNFWHERKSVSDAAKKMFIVDKIGSIAFLGAVIALIYFSVIFSAPQNIVLLSFDNISFTAEILRSMVSDSAFFGVALLLLTAILVRMGQFPFQNCLGASVEAPAPVSAVLQGVCPVVCGGFLFMRFYPLFILSENVIKIFIITGLFGALFFAYTALSQNNIKKLITYATSSQLGFALAGFGAGVFSGSVFYLIANGIAKVLLVMAAGAVVLAMNNENDIKYFGGLRKKMPLLALLFLIAVFALTVCTVRPGDMIVSAVFNSEFSFGYFCCLAFIFMNAFALFRAYFLIFEGKENDCANCEVLPKRLFIPMIISAFAVCSFGFIFKKGFSDFIYFIVPENYCSDMILAVVILTVVCFAVYIAFALYVLNFPEFVLLKERFLSKENLLYKLSYKAFYLDEIWAWAEDKIFLRFCRFLNFIDKYVVGGLLSLGGLFGRFSGYLITKLQNGVLQTYVFYTVSFAALLLAVIVVVCIIGSLLGV